MSMTASFGMNWKKSYGLTPTVDAFIPLDRGSDKNGVFMYIKATAAIAQYAWVIIDNAGNATEMTTTNAGSTYKAMGVCQIVGGLAINEYGFVWIGCGGGTGYGILGKVSAAYTAGVALYTTATSGALSSAVTTKVAGVVGGTTTVGAGTTELFSIGFLELNE